MICVGMILPTDGDASLRLSMVAYVGIPRIMSRTQRKWWTENRLPPVQSQNSMFGLETAGRWTRPVNRRADSSGVLVRPEPRRATPRSLHVCSAGHLTPPEKEVGCTLHCTSCGR